MKTTALLLFSWFILSAATAQTTTLSGRVKNATTTSIQFNYWVFPSSKTNQLVVPLNKKGEFTVPLKIEEPVDGLVMLGNEGIQLYLEPGHNTVLLLDQKNTENSLAFKGDRVKENEFLKVLSMKSKPQERMQKEQDLLKQGTPEQYVAFLDSILNVELDLLKQAFSLPKTYYPGAVAATYVEQERFVVKCFFDFVFRNRNRKLGFPEMYEMYQRKKVNQTYYAKYTFLDPKPKEVAFEVVDNALVSDEYRSYVQAYVSHKLSSLRTGIYWGEHNAPLKPEYQRSIAESYAVQQYLVAKMCLQSKTLEYALAYFVCEAFENRSFEEALPIYEKFKKDYSDTTLLHRVTQVYNETKQFAKGQPAPAFTLQDINGKTVSLNDFKGKTVYLDLWASWCAPCLQNMQYAQKLKEKFTVNDDVVFLYVTVDEDEKSWKKAVEKYQIDGVHLRAPKGLGDSVPKAYGVVGVPKYVIIDREGNIFDINAAGPLFTEATEANLRKAMGVTIGNINQGN